MTQQWLTAQDTEQLEEVCAYVWPDAPLESTFALGLFLGAAKAACIAYAPALPADADVPAEWLLAQIMQARNAYNAGIAPAGGGDASGGDYGIVSYPLDWHVKQLLRPQRAVGGVW